MKTAAAYIRVSTDDQIEYSPDSQLKLLRDYAKKNNYILPEEYIFQDDGISGKDAKHRPAFNRMLTLAKNEDHPIDTILVWKFSRFARNSEESIVIKNLLRKNGVDVCSISEPVDRDSAYGTLIERIIEWTDEYYLVNLSGEVKRGMLEKVSRGEAVTPAPFGYIMTDGKLFPHPEQADIIRSIFSSYLSGEGIRTIAKRLSAEGIRTKRGNLPDNRFIDYILNNPVYIGKIRWSKNGKAASKRHYDDENIIIVDGVHEAIITQETWDAVQSKLKSQKQAYPKYQRREQTVEFMAKGLIRCSSCGATLCQTSANNGLQCHNYSRGTCRESHYVSLSKLNNAIVDAIDYSCRTLDFKINPKSFKLDTSVDTAKLLKAEERKLARVKTAYENGIDTLEEYQENKKRIQATIAKLTEASMPAKKIDKREYSKKLSQVLEFIKDPNRSEKSKNEILRSVLEYAVFNRKENSLSLYFYI